MSGFHAEWELSESPAEGILLRLKSLTDLSSGLCFTSQLLGQMSTVLE